MKINKLNDIFMMAEGLFFKSLSFDKKREYLEEKTQILNGLFPEEEIKEYNKELKANGVKTLIQICSKKRQNLTQRFKKRLWERDKNICFYSLKEMTYEEATIEHLIPLSKGGKNNIDNLVLCLEEENFKLKDETFMEKIKYRERNFLRKIKKIKERVNLVKKINLKDVGNI